MHHSIKHSVRLLFGGAGMHRLFCNILHVRLKLFGVAGVRRHMILCNIYAVQAIWQMSGNDHCRLLGANGMHHYNILRAVRSAARKKHVLFSWAVLSERRCAFVSTVAQTASQPATGRQAQQHVQEQETLRKQNRQFQKKRDRARDVFFEIRCFWCAFVL